MAADNMPAAGLLDDRVRLYLGGHEIPITESYEVSRSILTQPSTFSARLGWGGVVADLLSVLIPGTPFELRINDAPLFTGVLDDIDASGEVGATEITIYGRDSLAPMHDAFVEQEKDYSDSTYAELVDAAFDATLDRTFSVVYSNASNRKLVTKISIPEAAPATPAPGETPDPGALATKSAKRALKSHIGERWYEFVKRELDRAGLFLWAGADGVFILSAPKTDQPAAYRILRRRGQTRNAVSVISMHFRNHTSGRYSEAILHARGGGKKAGRSRIKGDATDAEMSDYGFKRPLVLTDSNITNADQAAFYARRKLAETRRLGWSLVYTVAGHTIPSLLESGKRATWSPDTMVEVDDQELGVKGTFYIEKVVYKRGPATTCELTLSRVADMVFGKVDQEQ